MNDINNNKINPTHSMIGTLLILSNIKEFNINYIMTFHIIPSNISKCKILIRFRTATNQL